MESGGGVWHGMTIQDILQKVDLFNFTAEEGLEKIRKDTKDSATDNSNDSHEEKAQISNAAPSSAYLGMIELDTLLNLT